METYIYILKDPISNLIRYVGKSNNPKERLMNHLNLSKKDQSHKRNWILKLKEQGLKPVMEVIDVIPIDSWQFWETYWISQIRSWGFDLINYTNGGDGCSFANQTSFKKGHGGKKVVGFNRDYEVVYEFENCLLASKFMGVNRGTISSSCVISNRTKTVKSIAWFHKDFLNGLSNQDIKKMIDDKFNIQLKPNSGSFKMGNDNKRSKKVLMYDLDWNFIREFKSAKEAGEYLGVTGGAIQNACLVSKKNKCKNFKFKYK